MFKNFFAIAAAARSHLDAALGENWRETLVHLTFGSFMGALALLVVLLSAGVPIAGS
jgi:hypothetical protein